MSKQTAIASFIATPELSETRGIYILFLTKSDDGDYYYITNGCLDWSYTGLAEYYGVYYYVNGGVLDWNYSGLVEYKPSALRKSGILLSVETPAPPKNTILFESLIIS